MTTHDARICSRTTLVEIETDLETRTTTLAQLRDNLRALRSAAWNFPEHAARLAGLTRARLVSETPVGEDWELGPQP